EVQCLTSHPESRALRKRRTGRSRRNGKTRKTRRAPTMLLGPDQFRFILVRVFMNVPPGNSVDRAGGVAGFDRRGTRPRRGPATTGPEAAAGAGRSGG